MIKSPIISPPGLRAAVTSTYPLGACQVEVEMGMAETTLEPFQSADAMIAFWKSPTPGQTSYYGKIRTEGQGMLTEGIFPNFKVSRKVLVTGSSISF